MGTTAAPPYTLADPVNYWASRYNKGHTAWKRDSVHPLAYKGMEVIGVDIALPALTQFIAQSDQEWTETAARKLGSGAKLFTFHSHGFVIPPEQRRDGKIKLYWGDALEFSKEIEGGFDCIFDAAGIQVLDSEKAKVFASRIKSLLNPGGRLLLETGYYDPKILQDQNFKPPVPVPPPYSITVECVHKWFEPECNVRLLEQKRIERYFYCQEKILYDFLIVKK